MNEYLLSLISSVITGLISLTGVVIVNNKNKSILEFKVDTLTAEVRSHHDTINITPVLEEKIKSLTHRVEQLERVNKVQK